MTSNNNRMETVLGFTILLICVGFLIFSYKVADIRKLDKTYALKAKFTQVDGIIVGSDVMVSGIKIGVVSGLKLDPNTYRAIMEVAVSDNIKVPDDSSVQIVTSGVLGSKYVAINPGASEIYLGNGEEIRFTQSGVNLESLLGKLFFNNNADKKDSHTLHGSTPPAS